MSRFGLVAIGAGAALTLPLAGVAAPSTASDRGDASRATARAATVDLTAHRIRVGDHPAFVRVVVDFTDGRLGTNDSEAADHDPSDGRASLDVRHARIQVQAPAVRAHGVRVRITQAEDRIRVRLAAPPGHFKYMAHFQLRHPERVVVDLYKSRPPVSGAEITRAPDGCLNLDGWAVSPKRIRAFGTARFLFENFFQLLVRDAGGVVRGNRIVTVAESGRWRMSVRYSVAQAQAGTFEAVAMSARDGTLDCLVQTRVRLRR